MLDTMGICEKKTFRLSLRLWRRKWWVWADVEEEPQMCDWLQVCFDLLTGAFHFLRAGISLISSQLEFSNPKKLRPE